MILLYEKAVKKLKDMNSDLNSPDKKEQISAEELSGPLFVAIPVPASVVEIISAFVKDNSDLRNIKWIPEQNYHITLLYLGRIKKEAIPALQLTLALLMKTISSFKLTFKEITIFQNRAREKMIWAQFLENENFYRCSHKIREALMPLVKIDSLYQKPVPHITIARFKHSADIREPALQIAIHGFDIPVNHCELWESNRSDIPVYYTSLASFESGDESKEGEQSQKNH
jgi:2'-5' RNA ligase